MKRILSPALMFAAVWAMAILLVVWYVKDRSAGIPADLVLTAAAPSITFGSRTMSVKEFKAEHERLAGYIVNLLITLRTNHVVIDSRSPGITGTNWLLRIRENPENTNQMTVNYEL